jgi:hypothetical protein
MEQLDLEEAIRAKKAGMAQVDAGADNGWKELMADLVRQTAEQNQLFTTDDVMALFNESGSNLTTKDKRALGPVMMRAAKAGICKKSDAPARASKRRTLHASPIQVWESLIHGT